MRFSIFRRSPTRLKWTHSASRSISDFLPGINSLPIITNSAIRSMALAAKDNYRFTDHLESLREDPSMGTRLVEVASKLTPKRIPCRTLERAFSVLGVEQSNRLITFHGLRSALRSNEQSIDKKIDEIWLRSIENAFLAMELNDEFRLNFNGIEFTAALLADVGLIVLMLIEPRLYERIESVRNKSSKVSDAEYRLLGTDHGEIGVEYGLRQNFPVRIRRVIRFHHDSLSIANDERLLTDLVAAADEINPRSGTSEKDRVAIQRMISREFPEFAQGFDVRLDKLIRKSFQNSKEFIELCEFGNREFNTRDLN